MTTQRTALLQATLPSLGATGPIERLSIQAFRGIRDVELSGLSRVNLLVGSGNSGKTSILEALALLSAPLNFSYWQTIGRARDLSSGRYFFIVESSADSVRWFFPHFVEGANEESKSSSINVACSGSSEVKELDATCSFIRGLHQRPPETVYDEDGNEIDAEDVTAEMVEDEGWKIDSNCVVSSSASSQTVSYTFWSQFQTEPLPRNGPRLPSQFLPPYSHRNQPMQLQSLTKAVEVNEKEAVVELLRDLDRNILDLDIVADRRGVRAVPVIRHKLAGMVPISVLGDGARRVLTIALALRQNRDGILLIDEIEAALHINALDKLFPWMQRACREYNVQVFATTHSLEAISAITAAIKPEADDLSAYHLYDCSASKLPKRYSSGMLRRLVREGGLDIR